MSKKEINKNEFRKANNKKFGDAYRFIGVTHASVTDGLDNIPLEKNPEPGNKSKAFVRPISQKAHKASFGSKLKGWLFAPEDKKKIDKIKKKK